MVLFCAGPNYTMSVIVRKKGHRPDYALIACLGFLVIFGLVMLASASSNLGQARFGDSYFYFRHQLYYGLSLGLVGFFIASKFYYGNYRNRFINIPFLILTLFLLLMVFTPLGLTAGGGTRWLDIGPFSFQPAELLKLSLIMYLAGWLARREYKGEQFVRDFMPMFLVFACIAGILLAQKSTSPVAILLATAMCMYFISGARWRYIIGVVAGATLVLGLIIGFSDYRSERIQAFLNPELYAQGKGYQVIQSMTAIGAGGLTGVGYGQSTVKFRLPEPIGDSIFAVIAEELGFIGALLLLSAIGFLVIRTFLLARHTSDPFGRLLLIGFGSIIGIQSVVNIGSMTGVLPLTGAPLPFISYGGTTLAVFMTIGGIIVNVSKYSER